MYILYTETGYCMWDSQKNHFTGFPFSVFVYIYLYMDAILNYVYEDKRGGGEGLPVAPPPAQLTHLFLAQVNWRQR